MEILIFLVSLFLLISLISGIYKRIKFPNWAKWNPVSPWRITFIDRRRWIKVIIIKLGQFIVILCLLLILLLKTSFNLAKRMMPTKIPKL